MNLLFVCTHNRCRSILCEAVFNQAAGALVEAYSCGSEPAGVVYPGTLAALKRHQFSVDGLRSQGMEDFSDTPLDLVVTVCDSAAGEACPIWLDNTPRLHWPLPDPSKIADEDEQYAAFDRLLGRLQAAAEALRQQRQSGAGVDQVRHWFEA